MERTPEDTPRGEDPLADEQAEAAGAEAAAIGGPAPAADEDPSRDPVEQAGGGEAEGFEQAERDLVEHASHADPAPSPTEVAFTPEVEADRSTFVGGEPDEIDPTEVTRDPREGEDDPGAGPGLAADR